MTPPILTADDYALTDGVARSIETLAYARRLSATSVMTTMPEWPLCAPRLRVFRDRLSIGMHLNLTLGAPSGPMPRLAPQGAFPSLNMLMRASLLGHLAPEEVRAEIARQLDAFDNPTARFFVTDGLGDSDSFDLIIADHRRQLRTGPLRMR